MSAGIEPRESYAPRCAGEGWTAQAAASLENVLVGISPAMKRVRETIARLARSDLPVLIEGPTGCGKELVAQSLHRLSTRSGDLVAVNVAAVPHEMFEGLMFGHVRGAFSGAVADHSGYIAQANGGTLFLDELEALAPEMQPKLLRAAEDGCYRPIGAARDRRSDCRIVVATNIPIAVLGATGRLRRDLEFRLAKLVIRLLPLCERREDIPLLAERFLRRADRSGRREFTPAALRRLATYDWPGNARELKSTVETMLVLVDSPVLSESAIEAFVRDATRPHSSRSAEAERLIQVLESCHWHVGNAARSLAVHHTTLYRRMRRLGITRPHGGS